MAHGWAGLGWAGHQVDDRGRRPAAMQIFTFAGFIIRVLPGTRLHPNTKGRYARASCMRHIHACTHACSMMSGCTGGACGVCSLCPDLANHGCPCSGLHIAFICQHLPNHHSLLALFFSGPTLRLQPPTGCSLKTKHDLLRCSDRRGILVAELCQYASSGQERTICIFQLHLSTGKLVHGGGLQIHLKILNCSALHSAASPHTTHTQEALLQRACGHMTVGSQSTRPAVAAPGHAQGAGYAGRERGRGGKGARARARTTAVKGREAYTL